MSCKRTLYIYNILFHYCNKHIMATTGEGKVYSDPQFEGETSWPECLGGRNIRQQVTLHPQSGERGAPMLSSVCHVYPWFQPGKVLHTFRMGLPASVNQPSLRRRFVY